MPGLLGLFLTSEGELEENGALLNRMLRAATYRSSCLTYSYVSERVAIAEISRTPRHRRLRSFGSFDERYKVLFDGRLLGWRQLKTKLQRRGYRFVADQQEEVLLYHFIDRGIDGLHCLNGIYAAAVYDKQDETLHVFSDRYGSRHILYCPDPNRLIFASDIRCILSLGNGKFKVNDAAICDLYRFHFITGTQTMFEGIHLLPHGTVLKMDSDGHQLLKYWDYPCDITHHNASLADFAHDSSQLLEKAIGRQFDDASGIAISLSGGLDSRMIAGFASRLKKQVPLVHIGNTDERETHIAAEVANALGWPLEVFDPTKFDFASTLLQGVLSSNGHVCSDQYTFMPAIKRVSRSGLAERLLDGYALDVLFKSSFIRMPEKPKYSLAEKTAIILNSFSLEARELTKKLFCRPFWSKIDPLCREHVQTQILECQSDRLDELTQYFYFTNRGRRYNHGAHQVSLGYLEFGFPGLDYDLFDYAVHIPMPIRIKRCGKAELCRMIFTTNFPKLARIPWDYTGLPLEKYETAYTKLRRRIERSKHHHLNRLSRGSWPRLPRWTPDRRFREDRRFRKQVLDILLDPRTTSRGFIDRSGVSQLIRWQDLGRNVFLIFHFILSVEVFFRHFVDGPSSLHHILPEEEAKQA